MIRTLAKFRKLGKNSLKKENKNLLFDELTFQNEKRILESEINNKPVLIEI